MPQRKPQSFGKRDWPTSSVKTGWRTWLAKAGEKKGMQEESLEFRSDHAEGTASAEPSSDALHMHKFPRRMCLLGAC